MNLYQMLCLIGIPSIITGINVYIFNKMKDFFMSFKYAIEGIFKTIKDERNIKIHILAVIVVIIMGTIYKISTLEWIICIILFGLVMINTSIEHTVDLITKEENKLAKLAKDAAAGAVLVNAIASIIIAGIIWIPKIF